MTIDGFGGGVTFAMMVAAGVVPYWLLTAGLVGAMPALSSYLLLSAVMYTALQVPAPVVSAQLGLAAGLLAMPVAALAQQPVQLAIGAALLMGVCRFSVFEWGRWWRRATLELALGIAAVYMLTTLLRGGQLVNLALSVWGFFLIQSLFFLFARWLWVSEAGEP